MVFLPLLFTVNLDWTLDQPEIAADLFARTGIAFLFFCLLSGGLYLFNDSIDVDRDRAHPIKRNRPIASGRISARTAGAVGLALVCCLTLSAFQLELALGWVVLSYAVLQFAYSTILKRVVLLDVGAVSAGFVLRVLAGAAAIGVQTSPWLYICSGLGALFIALSKRRSELERAGDSASDQREILRHYTVQMLDQLIGVVATSALISYSLYTFSADALPEDHSMMLTIPLVAYGLFRYIYLVHSQGAGESPERMFLTDLPLLASIVLWTSACAAILVIGR